MKHPGDPTPRSASSVIADQGYKTVASDQVPQFSGQLTTVIVVLHCGSESYWMTAYLVTKANTAMTWQQVSPVVETRTTYRPVP